MEIISLDVNNACHVGEFYIDYQPINIMQRISLNAIIGHRNGKLITGTRPTRCRDRNIMITGILLGDIIDSGIKITPIRYVYIVLDRGIG